jgi:hypothetical protein
MPDIPAAVVFIAIVLGLAAGIVFIVDYRTLRPDFRGATPGHRGETRSNVAERLAELLRYHGGHGSCGNALYLERDTIGRRIGGSHLGRRH